MFEINDLVEFKYNSEILIGYINRIVKMSAPCIPSENPWEWDYHVIVEDSGKYDGTYCLQVDSIKAIKE